MLLAFFALQHKEASIPESSSNARKRARLSMQKILLKSWIKLVALCVFY